MEYTLMIIFILVKILMIMMHIEGMEMAGKLPEVRLANTPF